MALYALGDVAPTLAIVQKYLDNITRYRADLRRLD